jgi:outer membrane protein TolC
MKKHLFGISAIAILVMIPMGLKAQQVLSLEECREMAIKNNKDLVQADTKVEMAGYDRKIALANYFPNISASGAYIYNPADFGLISDEATAQLSTIGTTLHNQSQSFAQTLMTAITSNPEAAAEYLQSPLWQTILGTLSQTDLSEMLNALGTEIADAFHPDIENIFFGTVSAQQPVFMGGKIVASNKIAKLAEELAETQYDQKYQETVVEVDQAYWQIVSVANKLKLAEAYADLLHSMEKDVNISVKEGVATESDALQIKVKANEADMLKTKADNGLVLSKMLLCKLIGLDLNSDITLADETLEEVPVPEITEQKDMEQIYEDRPETRSLDLASQIYDKKVAVARADMMPQVAVMAGYTMTNPNLQHGFEKKWDGMFNAGVVVNIPIFHAFEANNKTRKAKAEATLYRTQLEDAKNLINLQVTQLRKQQDEAFEKYTMAKSNLESAEENLRTATVGFNEGVITTNTALGAQTAWLQAHSEYIDAGIELQMLAANIAKAEATYHAER